MYDTNKDEWYILPSFNMEKYSSSLVNVNDKVIYSFGGAYANSSHNDNKSTGMIERLNLVTNFYKFN